MTTVNPNDEVLVEDITNDPESEPQSPEPHPRNPEPQVMVTPDFIKQNYEHLKNLLLAHEKREKLKGKVDEVLRTATRLQENTQGNPSRANEGFFLDSEEPNVTVDRFTTRRSAGPGGNVENTRPANRGAERSPIRRMATLTGPRGNTFRTATEGEPGSSKEAENPTEGGEPGNEQDEDLVGPYQRKTQSRFTQRIAMAPKPQRLKMPSHVKPYNGLRDPDDHTSIFCAAAENHLDWTMPVWCHMFVQTLEGPARLWFNSLPPGSIDSFEELQDRFETHFMHQKRYEKDPVEIHNIKQGEHESILDFLKRFNRESMEIGGATESMRVSGYMHAIRNRQLVEQLNRKVPKTMKEAEQRSRDFVRGKEAAALTDGPPKRENKTPAPWRRETHGRGSAGPTRPKNFGWNKEGRPGAPYAHQREDRKQTFTALIKTPCEILTTEAVARKFVPPTTGKNMTGPTDKYCDYHQGTGHNTNECYQLRRKIEEAVRSGELAHLVKNIRSTNEKGGRKNNINLIEVPIERFQEERRPWWMNVPLTFHRRGQCLPSEEALVVTGWTRETRIGGILVDTGASTGAIYEAFFELLPDRVKRMVQRADTVLEGFNGDEYLPLGRIVLPITLGTHPQIRTERMEFYVIKGRGKTDMILGRPALRLFGAVPSTVHGVLMFPTKYGVARVMGQRRMGNRTRGQTAYVINGKNVGNGAQPCPEWKSKEICFPPQNEYVPTNEALVIRGKIQGSEVPRILVDSGSSTEVLYSHFFRTMAEPLQKRIGGKREMIEGFGGQVSWSEGTITLPLTLGVQGKNRTEWLTFSVVEAASRYDSILGRPGLMTFGAVASPLHSQIKFPTPRGVATVRGEKKRLICCNIQPSDQQEKNKRKSQRERGPTTITAETFGLGETLSYRCKVGMVKLWQEFEDVFAWSPADMTGVPRELAEHRLQTTAGITPVRQKRRGMAPDRLQAIRDEVAKLVEADIIREVEYQSWVANPVMVPKSDGSWRMCIDFKDINKACPKDNYPLPEIDRKVESLVGFKFKCFLDAYKGYHQIKMAKEDEDKTAFYTEHKLYCYKKMPFGLINAGATYQRLVDKVFAKQMGRNLEVYVDDLVIKSKTEEGLLQDIRETFETLRKCNMKLNPKKCTFGMEEGKFLGHIVTEEGIKVCPDQVRAIRTMKSPSSLKEVQSLNGKLAAMSRYLARSAERSLPFFKTLQRCINKNDFKWTTEAEEAFEKIKTHIANLPTLTAPGENEELLLYLATSEETIGSALMTERSGKQVPVYFVSKALTGVELNYAPMEKLALALIHSARRLRRYFQAYKIAVLTDMPIREILARPEKSGRLAKWAIELGEHQIEYRSRSAMKGQILADFVAEVQLPAPPNTKTKEEIGGSADCWVLYTDGASNKEGSGAGVVLTNPEGMEFTYALRFTFPCTNNEAEYEALLAGLRIALKMNAKRIQINVDSALVANQISEEYASKGSTMNAYKELVQHSLKGFEKWEIRQIPREQNTKADAASRIATAPRSEGRRKTLVEMVDTRSIDKKEINEVAIEEEVNWMTPIHNFLEKGEIPEDPREADKLRTKSLRFVIQEGKLYKRSFLMPLLRCVGPTQANYILREIHEGACGLHHGPRMIVAKVNNLGYFWPTMHRDAIEVTRKCISCQKFGSIPALPKTEMIPITSAWPFRQWGIDIVGPFPPAPGKVKFLVVAIDYFTKWIEAKPLAKITGAQVKNFVWEGIVCRFGLPKIIISDNGKQFAENPLKRWCREMEIEQKFTSVAHPQANGQVERANRSLVEGIKKRLHQYGGSWVDHLTHVLWAHRTTPKTSNGETPFSLTYGSEAVVPAEIGIHTLRSAEGGGEENDQKLRNNLEALEERREIAAIREAGYKRKLEQYYNKRVKHTVFQEGSYVWRKNEASLAEPSGKLGPNWEGPYQVKKVLNGGAYKLQDMEGKEVPRTWNSMNLKRCYV